MNHWKKAGACILSAALIFGTVFPAFAEAAPSKDENVFIILNADGSIRQEIVSDWLHSETGFDRAQDRSTLSDLQNLRTEAEPEREGEELRWTSEETDLYYQGTTTAPPPVTAQIVYELDGQQISAEELTGRSGHLQIRIKLENHEWETKTIAGRERRVCTPFITVIAADLPVETFHNLRAEQGTIQTDSSNQLVCFLALPGLAETLDGLLTGELSGIRDYLLDEVTIEADVEDCALPSILLAAATNIETLQEEKEGEPWSGLENLDELKGATEQLQDGAAQLHAALRADTTRICSDALRQMPKEKRSV